MLTRGELVGRRTFVALAWLFVGCLVVQLFLVGLEVFEALGESELHRDFAYTYGWLAPLLVFIGGLARVPRRALWLAIGLLVLYAVQTYLPLIAEPLPWLAAIHGVNALVVFTVAVALATSVAWNPAPDGTPGR